MSEEVKKLAEKRCEILQALQSLQGRVENRENSDQLLLEYEAFFNLKSDFELFKCLANRWKEKNGQSPFAILVEHATVDQLIEAIDCQFTKEFNYADTQVNTPTQRYNSTGYNKNGPNSQRPPNNSQLSEKPNWRNNEENWKKQQSPTSWRQQQTSMDQNLSNIVQTSNVSTNRNTGSVDCKLPPNQPNNQFSCKKKANHHQNGNNLSQTTGNQGNYGKSNGNSKQQQNSTSQTNRAGENSQAYIYYSGQSLNDNASKAGTSQTVVSANNSQPSTSKQQPKPATTVQQPKPSTSQQQPKPSTSQQQPRPSTSKPQPKPSTSKQQPKPPAKNDKNKGKKKSKEDDEEKFVSSIRTRNIQSAVVPSPTHSRIPPPTAPQTQSITESKTQPQSAQKPKAKSRSKTRADVFLPPSGQSTVRYTGSTNNFVEVFVNYLKKIETITDDALKFFELRQSFPTMLIGTDNCFPNAFKRVQDKYEEIKAEIIQKFVDFGELKANSSSEEVNLFIHAVMKTVVEFRDHRFPEELGCNHFCDLVVKQIDPIIIDQFRQEYPRPLNLDDLIKFLQRTRS